MATNNNNRPSNYVILTLRAYRKADDNGGAQLSPNSGQPFAKCRASLSMGKDASDNYKPSMWFELMGYTREGDIPDEVTEAVGALKKGDYVTVKGRMSYDEWTGEDGSVRTTNTIWVQNIEPFHFDNGKQKDKPAEDADDDFVN